MSNAVSFRWRVMQLFSGGLGTNEIAELLSRSSAVPESKVYNELAKARDQLHAGGLTFPTPTRVEPHGATGGVQDHAPKAPLHPAALSEAACDPDM